MKHVRAGFFLTSVKCCCYKVSLNKCTRVGNREKEREKKEWGDTKIDLCEQKYQR